MRSLPSAAAIASIVRSIANTPCGRPAPRYGVTITVLVYSDQALQRYAPGLYGPSTCVEVMIGTMIPYGVYAPLSCQKVKSKASRRPSSSKPAVTRCCWPRSCALEMKCSRRSSVHFTSRAMPARASRRAAQGTSTSSGHGCTIFTPKPPPTSGAMHSTLLAAISSFAATAIRTEVAAWVEV